MKRKKQRTDQIYKNFLVEKLSTRPTHSNRHNSPGPNRQNKMKAFELNGSVCKSKEENMMRKLTGSKTQEDKLVKIENKLIP